MNLVHHRLFRNKEKAVADVDRIGVVVIGALPVVPAVAPEQLVIVANVLVESNRVVPVWRIECFSKRRIGEVVVENTCRYCLWRTEVSCHSLRDRVDAVRRNYVVREGGTIRDGSPRESAGKRVENADVSFIRRRTICGFVSRKIPVQ